MARYTVKITPQFGHEIRATDDHELIVVTDENGKHLLGLDFQTDGSVNVDVWVGDEWQQVATAQGAIPLTLAQRDLCTDVLDGAKTLSTHAHTRNPDDWREMLAEMRLRITDLERGLGLN